MPENWLPEPLHIEKRTLAEGSQTFTFFGQSYGSVWVNTNGTLTFNGSTVTLGAPSGPANMPVLDLSLDALTLQSL